MYQRSLSLVSAAILAITTLPGSGFVSARDKKETRTGIELVGRTEKDMPPDRWSVLDNKTKKQIAEVSGRWGFQSRRLARAQDGRRGLRRNGDMRWQT
jgi:hypothetical protein